MIPAEQLAHTYQSNHWLAKQLLENISHLESLQYPPFEANCLNWVLGHILAGRNIALKHMREPDLWSEERDSLYRTGSEPISAEAALPLETLISILDRSQERLEEVLADAEPEFLTEIIPTRFGERPRWQSISGLAWHETFHIGQIDLLRAMIVDQRSA